MLKLNAFAFIGLLSAGILLQSCAHKVTRVSENEQIDISGRWNNTDSRLAAEELTKNVLSENWLSNFLQQQQGKKPVVIVGLVANKSHEHIDAETFTKDIERAFVVTQKVRVVQGGAKREELRGERADQQKNSSVSTMKKWGLEVGADYIMQGSINSIVDSHKRQKVVYYQVNMELTDLQTNEVVWIGEKKIAKYVKN
ncbi:penicillin-binding protein activator LpoB [Chitinophaga nivalis]|uniref:Penicillin-binding protein activator LpoB n=1 Tax=Chitinophaga nivalis TaxID=2991709 RepID=A0ABT3IGV5_9BACT|nr:penicillin-binding protein activator LpoB [Chitinophaga nivalis]MCW3467109.1 penicillin-binding protein activator LpoB [Chitinophaga nivalis]MCW3483200.1 penicillin-binding protein activator LpoB [Chitinophaga nivalis]